MTFRIELEREDDGRWVAEVPDLRGVMAYGQSAEKARAKVQALALRVVADRLDNGEVGPEFHRIEFHCSRDTLQSDPRFHKRIADARRSIDEGTGVPIENVGE